jgi:hypothetical protein
MKRNRLQIVMKSDEGKFAATIRPRLTLCGIVFMSLADVKRLGEEKTHHLFYFSV